MDEVEGTLLTTEPVTYDIRIVSLSSQREIADLGAQGFHVVGSGGGSIILERASNNIPAE